MTPAKMSIHINPTCAYFILFTTGMSVYISLRARGAHLPLVLFPANHQSCI